MCVVLWVSAQCVSFVVYCLLMFVCWLRFVVYYLLFVVCGLFVVAYCSWFVVCCMMSSIVACFSLRVVALFVVGCILRLGCLSLFIV